MKDGVPKPHVLELSVNSDTELFDSSVPACLCQHVVHKDIADFVFEEAARIPIDVRDMEIECQANNA